MVPKRILSGLGFSWVFFRKNDWVVFVFRAEHDDFPELNRKRIIYCRMSLQGESQTHYRKKYLHHITVCKLMVQGATHVMVRKKNNKVKPRKHWNILKKNKRKKNQNLVRPPWNRNPSRSNKTLKVSLMKTVVVKSVTKSLNCLAHRVCWEMDKTTAWLISQQHTTQNKDKNSST